MAFKDVGLLLLLFVLISCSSAKREKVTLTPEKEAIKTSEFTSKQEWELNWDKVLAEAKKEGKVVIASGSSPPIRQAITNAFEKKYGIQLEWVVGPWGTLPVKILTERAAGLYTIDINQNGAQPVLQMLKPKNVFAPILSNLILPEVKNEQAYWQGKYPLVDKDGLAWSMSKYGKN